MSFQKVLEQPGNVTLKGYWTAELRGAPGELKQRVEGYNVITTNGLESLARYLYSATTASTNTFKYIGIGTNSATEAASNTALGTESARHTGTVSYSSGAIYSVVATFTSGVGTGAIVEYGLFNSSTNGVMLSRDVESVINKGANDTLTVTAQITLA